MNECGVLVCVCVCDRFLVRVCVGLPVCKCLFVCVCVFMCKILVCKSE